MLLKPEHNNKILKAKDIKNKQVNKNWRFRPHMLRFY